MRSRREQSATMRLVQNSVLIIDERHILTASHCVTEDFLHEFLDIPWTVVAGTVDLKDRSSEKSRIVNGDFALPGQFPHQVSIQYLTSNDCTYYGCGGSIMDQWHVITAAHCVTDNVTHEILDLPWTVVAGTVDLKNRGVAVYHDVHLVFIPKSFMDNSPGDLHHDIAILRVYTNREGVIYRSTIDTFYQFSS
ncbi:unnamed protein product [Trichogramma brassicae]|uniref:Peptidase S1 domain-containing protein n=1 Tax=Trichogramma brassicae TaxID=86971 RepID=A0A6H5HY84_9HYME|nr:unnamed protein product [Trichogramma brassicae]